MPVIRISDPTWERLQQLATPFIDSPDDVIQKLLSGHEQQQDREEIEVPPPPKATSTEVATGNRLPRGIRLPMEDYYGPVLEAVFELGGRGRVNDVLTRVEAKLKHVLPEVDYQPLPSGNDIRWHNRAQWARKRLITKGLLKSDSEWGFWELTEEGTRVAEANKA